MNQIINTLLQWDDIQVDHFKNQTPNNILVITFTEHSNRLLDGFGFGTRYLLNHGFDVVAIKTNKDVWYENLTEEKLDSIKHSIDKLDRQYSLCAGYGSSMGAYATIRFSKILNIERVLAISPLYDIKFEWDTRWKRNIESMSNNMMMNSNFISKESSYFIITDPKSIDGKHLKLYKEIIPEEKLHILETPFSGHPSGYFLNQTGLLSDIALAVLKNSCFPENIRLIKTKKHLSKEYLFNLAAACIKSKKLNWALNLNQRAITINSENPEYHMQHCRILELNGNLSEAIEACARAALLRPTNIHFSLYRDGLIKKLEKKLLKDQGN